MAEAVAFVPDRRARTAVLDAPGIAVSQELGRRLFVVAGTLAALRAVAAKPGVTLLEPGTRAIPPVLDTTETMMLESWYDSLRRAERPGEGLSWDAPGFQSP